jgi:hypothetical protein
MDRNELDDDILAVGAREIAHRCFGGGIDPRSVYRLADEGWPIFKMLGKLTARPSTIRAEIERREQRAQPARVRRRLGVRY